VAPPGELDAEPLPAPTEETVEPVVRATLPARPPPPAAPPLGWDAATEPAGGMSDPPPQTTELTSSARATACTESGRATTAA
jgi:hypothetical protein